MNRIKVMVPEISSAGYDALYEIMELEFSRDGQVWQFFDVPETVWYTFCNCKTAQIYFNTHIIGNFSSKRIC